MSKVCILIIDDEKNIRRTLSLVLSGEGYEVLVAGSAEEGLRLLSERDVQIVLLDVQLPGINGVDALRRIKELDSYIEVIMISGHASLTDAAEATRLGAFDFLEKPLERERVLLTVRNGIIKQSLALKVNELANVDDPWKMIGESDLMSNLRRIINKVAPSTGRVLITGESGTGKELVARAIHRQSKRYSKPFVKVNCAAIPSELIESELFGHEKGSFSGAVARKLGQFEIAHTGTLFLDEIGDMSLKAQAKVLRVLQTGELQRVGGVKNSNVDVRVLAATNMDLEKVVDEGKFREDLFYRLNVVPIYVQPLRKRKSDIPLLAEYFVANFCKENGLRKKDITPDALNSICDYTWPGNVRELKNIMERLVILSDDPITYGDLPNSFFNSRPLDSDHLTVAAGAMKLKEFRDWAERTYIERTLRAYSWNVSRTAGILGIERTNLHKKIRSYGIKRET